MKPNNLTNYHSHCSYCDGRAPLESFIREAIAQGFTSYGVSSHAPLPFSTAWTMEFSDVESYLKEAAGLKKKYEKELELYVGLEIDYLDEKSNPANEYFTGLPLDYRIGSVHLLHAPKTGEVIDVDVTAEKLAELLQAHFDGDLKQMVLNYFHKGMRMLNAGGFDIVGHADKMAFTASCIQPDLPEQPWFLELMDSYFSLIRAKGYMVEINTKAYHKLGTTFPHKRLYPLLKELEIPVQVNADAHYPELINSGRPEALAALKEAGILTVMELHGGKWVQTPIG